MRLLRTLAHLALAFAFLSVASAQVQTAICAPVVAASPEHHDHAGAAKQVAHDHGGPANEHPLHKSDNCQTVCCFTASQLPAHAPETSAIEFFEAVHYVVAVEPASGRAFAPDPGVPKHLA